MRFTELLQAAEQVPVAVRAKNRRRPRRDDQVSPRLLPLLRNSPAASVLALLPGSVNPLASENNLALVKGIGFGLVLSAPLWAIIGAIAWIIL